MKADAKLFGIPIVFDESIPSGQAYFIGPMALENLQTARATDGVSKNAMEQWIKEGLLKFVNLTDE